MPTVPQLPPASSVSPTDQLLLSQGGNSASVTTQVLLASTQPQLTLAPGALLGRISSSNGGPEPVGIGTGLMLT